MGFFSNHLTIELFQEFAMITVGKLIILDILFVEHKINSQ